MSSLTNQETNNGLPATTAPAAQLKAEVESILGPAARDATEGKLLTFRVEAKDLHEACAKLRMAGYDYLLLMTAVDYPEQKRFELAYVVSNYTDGREVCLVADVNRDDPKIETVSDLWDTAEWHEREVYDLFGVIFEHHRDLRRILLDDSWSGYPLRKDYEDKIHDVIKRPY